MAEPLQKDAADGKHVCAHEAEGGEGDEDVKGAVGAELDEGEEDHDGRGDIDSVERYVPFLVPALC